MFKAILYTSWKWCRWPALVCAVLSFALPVYILSGISDSPVLWQARDILSAVRQWAPIYAPLAFWVGGLLGTIPWGVDANGRHVYALSLPVPRWHYVLLRF